MIAHNEAAAARGHRVKLFLADGLGAKRHLEHECDHRVNDIAHPVRDGFDGCAVAIDHGLDGHIPHLLIGHEHGVLLVVKERAPRWRAKRSSR